MMARMEGIPEVLLSQAELDLQLYEAATLDNEASVTHLLEQGAHPEGFLGLYGGSALHWAARQGNVNIAATLLDAEADVDHPDLNGITPYMLAQVMGQGDIMDLLENRGADRSPPSFGQKAKLFFSKPFVRLSASNWVQKNRKQIQDEKALCHADITDDDIDNDSGCEYDAEDNDWDVVSLEDVDTFENAQLIVGEEVDSVRLEDTPEDVADHLPNKGYRTYERIREASDFERGDHASLARFVMMKYPVYTHHAIVKEVHPDEGKITVIHFQPSGNLTGKGKVMVLEEQLTVRKERLFKVIYHPDEVLPPDEVVRNAEDMLGERDWKLFNNNCEHMATKCKTGQACSGQVEKALLVAAPLVSQRAIKAGITLLHEAFEAGIVTSLKAISSGKVLAAIKVTGRIGIIGVIIGSVVESVFVGYEAWRQKKRQGKGEITQREFEDIMVGRVTEGLFDIAGGVGGMLAGAAVGAAVSGPGAPVGALVGGIIGAIIGGLAGRGLGFFMGKFLNKLREEFEAFFKRDIPAILNEEHNIEEE